MPSIKEQYNEALALAKIGKYGAALDILSKLDHPAARKLEAQINARLDDDLPVDDAPRKQATRSGSRRWLWASLGAVLLVLAVFGFIGYSSYQKSAYEAHLWSEMLLVCYDSYPQEMWKSCLDLSKSHVAAYRDEIEFCLKESNDGALEEQLKDCLVENDADF